MNPNVILKQFENGNFQFDIEEKYKKTGGQEQSKKKRMKKKLFDLPFVAH